MSISFSQHGTSVWLLGAGCLNPEKGPREYRKYNSKRKKPYNSFIPRQPEFIGLACTASTQSTLEGRISFATVVCKSFVSEQNLKIWRCPIRTEVMSFLIVLIGQCWITTALLLTSDLQTTVPQITTDLIPCL